MATAIEDHFIVEDLKLFNYISSEDLYAKLEQIQRDLKPLEG